MRIVLIHNTYIPETNGGAELVVKAQAEALAKAGNEVTIIIPAEKESTYVQQNGVIVRRVKILHLFPYGHLVKHSFVMRLFWHSIDMFNIVSYFQIKKILSQIKPNKVICHNIKGVGFFTPAAIRALAIQFELYLHDIQLAIPSGILIYGEENTFINNGTFQKLYEMTTSSLLGSPDIVLSPSTWLLDFYSSRNFFSHSKKIILKNTTLRSVDAISKKLHRFNEKIESDKIVFFVYIGKIEVAKGILWLANIWSKLPKSFHLSIYGRGSAEGILKQYVRENSNITFHGFIDHSNISQILKENDMLIMPSLCYENRPEVILDAHRASTPVIASNSGGIPELLEVGKTGYLFTPGDDQSFIQILTRHA